MGEAACTVLVIDGDPRIRRFISADLEPYGYVIRAVETGWTGLNAAAHQRPDLIILDPALPDMNGVEVLNVIRSWSNVPVIVLSFDTDEERKVQLLRSGADDYMTKPFGMAELAARCEAVLRRSRTAADRNPVVQTGPLTIDFMSRAVMLDGRHVTLTRKEYQLLHLLASHVGLVITHNQLIDSIWGNALPNNVQYLRTLMRKLRQKLEIDPGRRSSSYRSPASATALSAVPFQPRAGLLWRSTTVRPAPVLAGSFLLIGIDAEFWSRAIAGLR